MNKNRKKKLDIIVAGLFDLLTDLETIRDEEQVAYENLPESLQEYERGRQIVENADNLSTACDDLDNLICTLDDIQ